MPRSTIASLTTKRVFPSDLPNPFHEWQAEDETRLKEFFVQGPHYEDIFRDTEHPRTCFVFAAHGGGKTAYRLMLQRAYRPHRRDSTILATTFLDARTVRVELGDDLSRATFEHHLRFLLKATLSALLLDFLADPALFFGLGSSRRTPLIGLFQKYIAALSNSLDLSDRLRQWGYAKLADTIEQEMVPNVPTVQAAWNMLHALRSESVEPPPGRTIDHLELLLTIFARCGLQGVCALVDNIEQIIPSSKVEEAVTFLWALCEHLPELAHLPLAFKFFLPIELATGLRERGVRFDLYPRYDLEWTDDLLMNLLRTRLRMASDGHIVSLGELAEEEALPKLREGTPSKPSARKANAEQPPAARAAEARPDKPPLAKRLDEELVLNAYGSPRQLLILGDLLLTAYRQRPGEDKLFSEDDLQWAIETFQRRYGTLVPPLRIDEQAGRAYIGARELELTKTEFKCLVFLKEARGGLRKKDAVWKELFPDEHEFSDQQVDTFFSRLRKKLERDPRNPVYLKVEKKKGYRLENVA